MDGPGEEGRTLGLFVISDCVENGRSDDELPLSRCSLSQPGTDDMKRNECLTARLLSMLVRTMRVSK